MFMITMSDIVYEF